MKSRKKTKVEVVNEFIQSVGENPMEIALHLGLKEIDKLLQNNKIEEALKGCDALKKGFPEVGYIKKMNIFIRMDRMKDLAKSILEFEWKGLLNDENRSAIEQNKILCKFYDHDFVIRSLPIYKTLKFKDNVVVIDSSNFSHSPVTEFELSERGSGRKFMQVSRCLFSSLSMFFGFLQTIQNDPSKKSTLLSPPLYRLNVTKNNCKFSIILTEGVFYEFIPVTYQLPSDRNIEFEIVGMTKGKTILKRWKNYHVNIESKQQSKKLTIYSLFFRNLRLTLRNIVFADPECPNWDLKTIPDPPIDPSACHDITPLPKNIRCSDCILMMDGECSSVLIENCIFERSKKQGGAGNNHNSLKWICRLFSVKNIEIRNSIFTGRSAVSAICTLNVKQMRIEGSKFHEFSDIAVWAGVSTEVIMIDDSEFVDTSRAVFVEPSVRRRSKCRIQRTNVKLKSIGAVSEGNIIRRVGFSFLANCDAVVKECRITGVLEEINNRRDILHGGNVDLSGILMEDNSNLTVENCLFEGHIRGVGINMNNTGKHSIIGSTFINCSDCGVSNTSLISPHEMRVEGCKFEKCTLKVIVSETVKKNLRCDGIGNNELFVMGNKVLEKKKKMQEKSMRKERKSDSTKYRSSSNDQTGECVVACQKCGVLEQRGEKKFKVCGNCRLVYYCSIGCQRKNWSVHKKVCAKKK